MANIIEMTYTFDTNTAKNHFSTTGSLKLGHDAGLIALDSAITLYQGNFGEAIMNNTGKSILYPTAAATPYRLDLSFVMGCNVADAVLSININDTSIYSSSIAKTSYGQHNTYTQTNIINNIITTSNKNSKISVYMSASENSSLTRLTMKSGYMKLYFQQWDLIGYSTGDGVQAVISPGRLYAGETGTFSTILNDNSEFHGWYKDAAHTQLVSTNQTYTVTASEDLTLYAYTTKKVNKYNNKIYFKGLSNNSKWKNPYSIYKKTINGWELQTDITNINNNYIYFSNGIIHDITNTTYRITVNTDSNPFIVYYLNNNLTNKFFTSITTSESFYFIPLEEGLALIYNGNFTTTNTQTLTVSWADTETFVIQTMTIIATPQPYNQNIYFIDKDGNKYIETKISNEGYSVTTPSGYVNFIGWREIYNGVPTGRILEVGQTYYDVGQNNEIYYEPVFNE